MDRLTFGLSIIVDTATLSCRIKDKDLGEAVAAGIRLLQMFDLLHLRRAQPFKSFDAALSLLVHHNSLLVCIFAFLYLLGPPCIPLAAKGCLLVAAGGVPLASLIDISQWDPG